MLIDISVEQDILCCSCLMLNIWTSLSLHPYRIDIHGSHIFFPLQPLYIFLLNLGQFVWSRESLFDEGCLNRWHLKTFKNDIQMGVENGKGREPVITCSLSHLHFKTQTMVVHNNILLHALNLSKPKETKVEMSLFKSR